MNYLNKAKQVTEMMAKHNADFRQDQMLTFSNLMWQMIVNKAYHDKLCCFTATYHDHAVCGEGNELVIVRPNGSGYHPTGVKFIDTFTYERRMDTCDQINHRMFKLNPDQCAQIIGSSMALSEIDK